MTIPIFHLLTYAFSLWFGLHMVTRHYHKPGIRLAGLGLISYATGIGLITLGDHAASGVEVISDTRLLVSLLPSMFWLGAALHLIPPDSYTSDDLKVIMLPAIGLVVILGIILIALNLNIGAAIPLALAVVTLRIIYQASTHTQLKRPYIILFMVTIFYALGIGVIIFPTNVLSGDFAMLAIGFDLAALAYVIGVLDAYDEGEMMAPDFLRSLATAALISFIFGLQIIMVMSAEDSHPATINIVLFATITTAIIVQTFAEPLQRLIDQAVLPFPIQHQREELRDVSDALSRKNTTLELVSMEEEQFNRLTRRALSNMGDLSRLAVNPLTQLPQIDDRLRVNEHDATTLERARELKAILTESIMQLKPTNKSDFGNSDEWRHYNALYFPYVVGLKPYSRRTLHEDLDHVSAEALEWFRIYVPERTLYNWQNAASKLIATHLRETGSI